MQAPAVQPLMKSLKTHGRFAFSRIDAREGYTWPEGKKLAVYIALNVECFSFREGRGVAPVPPNGSQWVGATAWREYGNRVGLWRILEVLEELELMECVEAQCNTACFEHCPGLIEELHRRGVEFVGHGYTNSVRLDCCRRALASSGGASLAQSRRRAGDAHRRQGDHEDRARGRCFGVDVPRALRVERHGRSPRRDGIHVLHGLGCGRHAVLGSTPLPASSSPCLTRRTSSTI